MTMSEYEYICSAGETFDSVALAVYDDEKYAAELLCANPEHSGKEVFDGSERLRLPEIEIRTDGGRPVPEKAPWKE